MSETRDLSAATGHWISQVGTVDGPDGTPQIKVLVDHKMVSVAGVLLTPAQVDVLCTYLRQAQATARFRAPLDIGPSGIVDQGWYWRCTGCGTGDAAYISEEAAQGALDHHKRTECEDRPGEDGGGD